jgi:type VI protein secretion system component Hcp
MADKNYIYLELVGPTGPVGGSSTDQQFFGQIEVDSFTFTVSPVPRSGVRTPSKTGSRAFSRGQTAPRLLADVKGKKPDDPKEEEKEEEKTRRKDDALVVVKPIDVSSPALLQAYCQYLTPVGPGQQKPLFPSATFTFRLFPGDAPLTLLVLVLSGAAVIDYQLQPINKDTTHPTEKVTFSYKTLEIQYTQEPDLASGAPMRSVTFQKTQRKIQ